MHNSITWLYLREDAVVVVAETVMDSGCLLDEAIINGVGASIDVLFDTIKVI